MAADMEAVVARARAMVGVRFRPQGRSTAGLDCIGVIAAALDREAVVDDYSLRGSHSGRCEGALRAAGLRLVHGMARGDVLVMRSGPEQLHLGLWTGDGLVHADARLRRVVERPGAPPWPVLGIWRLEV